MLNARYGLRYGQASLNLGLLLGGEFGGVHGVGYS
jgi:hypothetical protein